MSEAMIDAHHHMWAYRADDYPWIPVGSALHGDFLEEEARRVFQQSGITGSVVVQARQSLEETRWLLDIASRAPFIRGVVGWVPLASPDIESCLAQFSTHSALKGVRHVLQDEPDAMFDDADFNRGLSHLPAYGLCYDLLIFQRQLPAALRMVQRHPEVSFVIDHLAKPEIYGGRVETAWRDGMAKLATLPQIKGVKLSGLATEVRSGTVHNSTYHAYFDAALELYGPDRLMIGSDWPVCLLALPSYAAWTSILREWIARQSSTIRASLLAGNATRVYGLD